MKNQDLLSKRILNIALAISMVVCSVALFIFALNFTSKSNAATPSVNSANMKMPPEAGSISSAGIKDGYIYYIYTSSEGTSHFWRANINSFKDAE